MEEFDDEEEASFTGDSSSSSEEEEEDEEGAEEARKRAMVEAKAMLQDKKDKSKDRYLEDEVRMTCLARQFYSFQHNIAIRSAKSSFLQ